MLYTINANTLPEVQKVFNRYAKKAQTIGLECSLEVVRTYIKEVTVWEVDHVTHTQYKVCTTPIDVVDIELNYPEYKLGNYTVVAVIEHGDEDKNLVYPCGDYEVPNHYYHGKGICEHCGTNHKRIKTVLLKDNNNNLKQVGTGCLKEYTGVTDINLVSAYITLDNIINTNNSDFGIIGMPKTKYIETFEYLTRCIHLYIKSGYNKDNKYEADKIKPEEITKEDRNKADEVINFFNTLEDNTLDNFLHNIKIAVTNSYCKPNNGFVAYAYVAYIKELERLEKLNQKKEELSKITFYGELGDKIKNIEVTGNCCAGYDTIYGYVYIYKFQDINGHVFIWKTSKDIDRNDDGTFTGTISGTIKAHEEYAGEKQTVLTRCKVVASI